MVMCCVCVVCVVWCLVSGVWFCGILSDMRYAIVCCGVRIFVVCVMCVWCVVDVWFCIILRDVRYVWCVVCG